VKGVDRPASECALVLTLTRREEHRLGVLKEGTGGWRRLHNKERHNFYPSINIIRVIKSRRMEWARHVTRMKNEEWI
jgi:hypothetical protein